MSCLKGKLHLPTINIQEISWVKGGLVKVDKLISYTKSLWCGSSDCSQQLVGRVYRSTLQRLPGIPGNGGPVQDPKGHGEGGDNYGRKW